jgi:hypothetical protein
MHALNKPTPQGSDSHPTRPASQPTDAAHLMLSAATRTADSSSTSRASACSRVSPTSRNPARVEYLVGRFSVCDDQYE